MNTFNVRVLGGLPLKVEVDFVDSRDSGLEIDDMQLTDRNGRRANWAEKRMSPMDWERLEEQVWENREAAFVSDEDYRY